MCRIRSSTVIGASLINRASGPSGIRVPSNAVVAADDGGSFVWRVGDDMKVVRAPVELGGLSGGQVAITHGLEQGQVIAISGVYQLREGMQVRALQN